MPVSNPRPLQTDPLRSFKFNVVIPQTMPGAITSGGMQRLGFMSMSGLGLSIEPLTYREGGDNLTTRKMPGQADFNPITLSRGLFPRDNDNWIWMQYLFSAMYGQSAVPANVGVSNGGQWPVPNFRTVMYINVLQHPNTYTNVNPGPVYNASYPYQNSIVQISFKLYSAWISSLAYSDMDAGGNAVAVEQMTLNYEGFETNWGGNGYVANPIGW